MIEVGTKVRANWRDYGFYYEGKVIAVNLPAIRRMPVTYDIKYDDGAMETDVSSEHIIGTLTLIHTFTHSHIHTKLTIPICTQDPRCCLSAHLPETYKYIPPINHN